MAVTYEYYPLTGTSSSQDAELSWNDMFLWMRTNGILTLDSTLNTSTSDLAVTPGTGLQVQVAQGEAFIQGNLFVQNDNYTLLSIDPNSSGMTRIDLICLQADFSNFVINYEVIDGTPAMSPVPPTPIQTETLWQMPLAFLTVASGAMSFMVGDISDQRVYSLQDGREVTLTSDGTMGSQTLVAQTLGPDLAVYGIRAGAGIGIAEAGGDITITNTDGGAGVTLSNAGVAMGNQTLVNDGTGPTLATKGLVGGTGITLSSNATDLTITNSDTGSAVTLTNAGTTSLVNDGVGPALANKGLVAGTGVSFSTSATDVTINATGSEVSLTTAGADAGTTTLVNTSSGPNMKTKGLVAGTNVSFSTDSTDITISSTTPTLTTAGADAGTTTLVNTSSGPNMKTKGLVAGTGISFSTDSTDVTITNSSPGSSVTLTSGGADAGTTTLVNTSSGPNVKTKGLVAGTGISFSADSTDVTISSAVTLATGGADAGTTTLVNTGSGATLKTKGLVAGTGISFSTDSTDVTITNSSPGSSVTLTSGGADTGTTTLVNTSSGPNVKTKGLVAGTGISFSTDSTDVTISSAVTLATGGADAGTTTLVNTGSGATLKTKGLVAGSGISFSTDSTDVTITNSDKGSSVTLASAGADTGTTTLVNTGTGPSLKTKGLVAGTGISFTTDSTDVTIASAVTLATGGADSGTTTLVNTGSGATLKTKGLVAGTNITFSTDSTDVTIKYLTPACQVGDTTGQTLNNGAGAASITWNTNVYDTTSMHSTSVNTQRININTSGLYLLNLNLVFSCTNPTGGPVYGYIYNKAGALLILGQSNPTVAGEADVCMNISVPYNSTAASDYVYAQWLNTCGVTITLNTTHYLCNFSASYIGTA